VDCIGCHQLGQESTRTIPASLGKFDSGADAWQRRILSGQSGESMTNRIAGQFGGVPYKYFADWTDRIAKGELPKSKPSRPEGEERNVVVTSWEWSTPDKYLHELISSDRRYPTVNAYGPLFGSPEYSTDNMPILDPKTYKVSFFKMPGRDPEMPVSLGPGHAGAVKQTDECPYALGEATPARSNRRPIPRIGAARCCGIHALTTTTPCSISRAASGWRPRCAAWTTPPGARRARRTHTQKPFPRRGARGRSRCLIRRR